MAWNESGGGKNKDPWGSKNKQDGPPDLDELIKKMQDKFNNFMGGKGKKKGNGSIGGGSGGGGVSIPGKFGIGLIIFIALAVWRASGFYKIGAAERGLVLRFGAHVDTVDSGLHWHFPTPIEKVLIADVNRVSDFPHGSTMLTEDQNIIDVEITVQYRIKDAEKYFFNLREPEFTLKEASESALRQHVGRSTMDYVFGEGREEIAHSVEKTIQEILDSYNSGLHIERVNMQEAKPPEAVKAAFDDVTQAEEDEVRLRNQAEAYRNEVIPRARGEAAQQKEAASAYKLEVVARAEGDASRFGKLLAEYEKAPKVTRDRLYLDALQSVLSSTTKIMIDVKGGNNMIYLPLDKMIGSGSRSSSTINQTSRVVDEFERAGRDAIRKSGIRNRNSIRSREIR